MRRKFVFFFGAMAFCSLAIISFGDPPVEYDVKPSAPPSSNRLFTPQTRQLAEMRSALRGALKEGFSWLKDKATEYIQEFLGDQAEKNLYSELAYGKPYDELSDEQKENQDFDVDAVKLIDPSSDPMDFYEKHTEAPLEQDPDLGGDPDSE